MGTILDEIVATKRRAVAQAEAHRPIAELRSAAADAPAPRDLHAAIVGPAPAGIHVIAELKRRSPSAGVIRADFDPAAIARRYESAGASAISVLTDEPYFDGKLGYLAVVKAAARLPVLRKDFIVAPYQVYESRAAGADALLLIGEPPDWHKQTVRPGHEAWGEVERYLEENTEALALVRRAAARPGLGFVTGFTIDQAQPGRQRDPGWALSPASPLTRPTVPCGRTSVREPTTAMCSSASLAFCFLTWVISAAWRSCSSWTRFAPPQEATGRLRRTTSRPFSGSPSTSARCPPSSTTWCRWP